MGFTLTKSQEQTVQDALHWFYHESKQVFEIDGEAGTGKSVVLYEIVRRLKLEAYQYMSMAYTGQASIVMRTKNFSNARSIHSSLYEIVRVEKQPEQDPFKAINTKYNTPIVYYEFRELPVAAIHPSVELFVIDEGYMVPKYMRNAILKHGKKVLVAGDCGQLDPIGDEPAFLTGYGIHHLTELMRQAESSPIVYLARRARRGEPIHNGLYGDKVLVINDTELTENMILNVGNILCGTNKTRDYFNQLTRKQLGIVSPAPMYGERVICRNNNWFIEEGGINLANGLTGTVVSQYGPDSFDGKTLSIDFLADLCPLPFEDLKIDYEYIISPYDIRKQLKEDEYHNCGELFEFAYALTTHLSQGAEFPAGIYFEEFLRSNIQNKLNYTGITRFKERMIYVKKTRRLY